MDEINKKLHEINKKLENKIEEINKKLHEINQQLENKELEETNKKLEETNKKMEERDKKLAEICNKAPVSYTVSGLAAPVEGDTITLHRKHCMGQYYPTGKSLNGFPTFRNGKYYLYVHTEGNWRIGYKRPSDTYMDINIHQSDKNHTPSTPPRNGWKIWNNDSLVEDTTLVHPRSFIIYRLTCFDEDLPDQNTSDILGDYIPTGEFVNGCPIFNKRDYFLLVDTNSNRWIISKSSKSQALIYHPEKDPVPLTPPPVGWKFPQMAESIPSVTVFPVIGTYAYENHQRHSLYFKES